MPNQNRIESACTRECRRPTIVSVMWTGPLTPMLASTGPLPAGPGWAYEFKWDGVRALASLHGGALRLHARSGAEITAAYPELAPLATLLDDAELDGEIVALDPQGRPSFTALA